MEIVFYTFCVFEKQIEDIVLDINEHQMWGLARDIFVGDFRLRKKNYLQNIQNARKEIYRI